MARFGNFDQYLDNAGDPLVEGKLYFYESGTTTPKNTYADVNNSIPNTNPVILSAAGRQPNIFFEGTAKVILTDKNDVQIAVRDPVGETATDFGDAWVATKIYSANDVVLGSDSVYYRSLSNGNQNNNPVTSTGFWTLLYSVEWNSGITYQEGAVVTYNGEQYQSLQGSNLNNNPSTATSYWVLLSFAWISTATYDTGMNAVASDGVLYTSLQDSNTGNDPTSSPAWWVGTSAAAAASATAAAASATAAAASETAAAASETAAAASETAAAASESAAATSETNAAASASAASTSETNAAASETAAAASAAAAAASYDDFDDRYLGAKASDPTTDNDGNALITGSLYFNTTTNVMKVYNGSAWQAVEFDPDSLEVSLIPSVDNTYDLGSATKEWRNLYVDGTASIDSLIADTADINGGTIDGAVIGGSSAAAITGTTITGTSFVSSGDMTFGDSNKAIFGAGSDLQIYHDGSHSYVSDQGTGNLLIRGENVLLQKADGTENYLRAVPNAEVKIYYDGSEKLTTTSTGIDVTGTVVSDGLTVDTNTLYVDATNNRVGIGTTSPVSELHVADQAANAVVRIEASVTGNSYIYFDDTTTNIGKIGYSHSDDSMQFDVYGSERMRIDSSGNVGIGTSSPARSIHVAESVPSLRLEDTDVAGLYGEIVQLSTGDLSFRSDHGNVQASTSISFSTDGTEKVRIDSSGNVGIGTTTVTESLDANGNIKLRASTAARYVYSAVGDSTTVDAGHKYDPVSDYVATLTGGSERMRVDSSGNVGIGVTPSNLQSTRKTFEIGSSSSRTGNGLTQPAAASYIQLNSNTEYDATGNAIYANTVPAATYVQYNGEHIWNTAASGTAGTTISFSEAMRIDSSGNVGIGTSSPTHSLHIEKSGTQQVKIVSTTSSTEVRLGASSTNAGFLWTQTADPLAIGTNATERMRIDSSGNVGIGKSSISYKLDVAGATSTWITHLHNTASSPDAQGLLVRSDATSAHDAAVFGIYADSGYKMLVKSSGNVGIGTTSPSAKLDVDLGTTGTIAHFEGDLSDALNIDGDSNAISLDARNVGHLGFEMQGTEAMRIDSSGNLLVGKTSADSGATAGIETNNNGRINATRDGSISAVFNRLTSDGDIAQFRKDGTTVGSIGTRNGTLYTHSPSGTNGAGLKLADGYIVPCESDGSGSDADTDLGLSGTRFKDLYLSGGVYVGGTTSANLLDDYETGTFTPTIVGATTAGTGTYTTQEGIYTKVGNLVTVSVYLVWTAHTGTGSLTISNLPFVFSGTTFNFGEVYASEINAGTGATSLMSFGKTTGAIQFRGFINNLTRTVPTVGDNTSGTLGVTISYRVS